MAILLAETGLADRLLGWMDSSAHLADATILARN
jgi:hypothetical protein